MAEKVLIVDDDKAFLAILAERMQNRGMEVSTAESAAAAMQLLAKESYDAVLLDLMMPEMGGIEAFQIMRRTQPEVQVIFLTGHPSVSKGVEAMKLGAMDFLPKPVDMNELSEKIKQAKASRMILAAKRTQEKIRRILTDKSW
ncbi:MAG TPA: response regulator [Desulfobacterales bacterium]|jgi:DNA-binding NtrC family response regulator|nr:response regulator [Desulfobacterales bacterium]